MRIERGLLEGQVLQRKRGGASAEITGSTSGKGPVYATIDSDDSRSIRRKKIGVARAGHFKATLSGLPPGGPYTITLQCEDDTLVVRELFVGDLWLMAGQSNMQGCGSMAHHAQPHPKIRAFTMARRWEQAREPLHIMAESPDPVHDGKALNSEEAAKVRRNATSGSGMGLYFARLMFEHTGVPQGLIPAAHGGTSMKQWDPALKKLGGRSLYGSMWLSVEAIGQPLAGVLWYQGESEALPELAAVYVKEMRRLIGAVRKDTGQPDLPWHIVQLGRMVKSNSERWPDPAAWNAVQEHQRRLPELISNCTVVPTIDLELEDLIHLRSTAFPVLAERQARTVREKKSLCLAPVSALVHPDFPRRIVVKFSGNLKSTGMPRGFTIVAKDGQPLNLIYRTDLAADTVTLYLTGDATKGSVLHYGYGLDPVCSLSDTRDMPVPVFGPFPIALKKAS